MAHVWWSSETARVERLSEIDYLRSIERLAHDVVAQATAEAWFAFGEAGQQAPNPLQRRINALATHLRFLHTDDGCVEHVLAGRPDA